MKNLALCAGILFCFLSNQSFGQTVKQFNWLGGLWSDKEKGIYESWEIASDTLMMGLSYHIDEDGEHIIDEMIRLVARPDGIYYIPVTTYQGVNNSAEFKLVESSATSFIAENKEHDYPQRIGYSFVDAQKVRAYIEGTNKGVYKKIEFNYSR